MTVALQHVAPADEGAEPALAEGVWENVAEAHYHADPAPKPSLSASVAKILLSRSPLAARWAHPRLRPSPPEPEAFDDKKAFGTAVHKLVLGRGRQIVEVDAANWQSKAAREERDAIAEAGRLPVLKDRYRVALDVARALRPRVALPSDAATELVLVWRDRASDGTPVWCRSMLDAWIEPMIVDLKITGGELSDGYVARQIAAMSYDVSMAFYRRGMARLRPDLAGRVRCRLIFAERNAPHDVFAADLTEGDLAVADRMVQRAIDRWAECLRSGDWPGVAPEPRAVPLPDFARRAFIESELETL